MSAPLSEQQLAEDDAFWAQARAREEAERGREADPSACGTCKDTTEHFGQVEHEQCAQRATLLQAPDHPGYELITGLSEAELRALPARFHVPVFMDTCTPTAWVCAVCWGEGWTSAWPCQTAHEYGTDVFTPGHDAQQHHDRTAAELIALRARVADLDAKVRAANEALDDAVTAINAKDERIAELQARLFQVGMATTYRLESGKKFVYVEDIADAVLGRPTAAGGAS